MNQLLAMRIFIRVVETASFNRAADQLAIPRSTVSKLVIDLEKHLNTKLIHRTTRALKMTVEGIEYYHLAVRLIAEIDAADNQVRKQKISPSGQLKISVISSFSDYFLIPKLPNFYQQYPDIKIVLGSSDRVVNLVGDGIDCAIRAGNLHDTSIIARKIFDLSYVTCASTNYIDKMGKPLSPKELKTDHQLINYSFSDTDQSEPLIFDNGTQYHELSDFNFSANEGNSIVQMIRCGLGVGQPLKYYVQSYLDSGELVTVLDDWQRPALPVYIVYPQNKHQSTRLKIFVDWIMEQFKEDAVF